jgi:hypothetical protein
MVQDLSQLVQRCIDIPSTTSRADWRSPLIRTSGHQWLIPRCQHLPGGSGRSWPRWRRDRPWHRGGGPRVNTEVDPSPHTCATGLPEVRIVPSPCHFERQRDIPAPLDTRSGIVAWRQMLPASPEDIASLPRKLGMTICDGGGSERLRGISSPQRIVRIR